MPLLLKASIKRTYAENLLNDIALNRGQYFLFVAKGTPWDATAGASADIIPVTPPDTVKDEYDIMRSVIGYKKLDPNQVVFALPRVPWEISEYDAYEDDEELFNQDAPKNFYVVTSANNIYKCLKRGSGNSVVQPSHTSTTPLEYSDGYTWKYLATVKESQLPYELTDYVPVNYALVQQDTLGTDSESTTQYNTQRAAVRGEITRLDLVDTGITGASAAVYLGSEYGSRFSVGITGSTSANASYGVGDYFTITSSTNSNQFSLPVSDISNYEGYVLRIVGVCGGNPSDINNYGIIHGVTASSNQYTFTVRGEHVPFNFSYNGTTDAVYYDIIPHARISGDGSGAYGFLRLGRTGDSDWRRVNGVDLVDGGQDYSQAVVQVVSAKSDGSSQNTVHPTIKAVLPPKDGHGSNILKELNVQDVILIATVDQNDEAIIQTGGSYRKFGIIKDPILNDGSGVVAGTREPYYRNLLLLYLGASYSTKTDIATNYFPGTTANFIIGKESFATFPVVETTAYSDVNGEKRVQVKVKNTAVQPVTWLDRLDNYELTLSPAKSGFVVGEKVYQSIPAGITIAALGGISYGFGISAEATVLSATPSKLEVKITKNAFVRGSSNNLWLYGFNSGITAFIGGVSLGYGEYVYINKGLSLATEAGKTSEFFKIITASTPYFSSTTVPSYTGLTVLRMSRPSTLSAFTSTTWQNGDYIQQGVSGSYLYDYAAGTVYKWTKTDDDSGLLYITEPFGTFKYSTLHGNTFSRLNTSGGSVNLDYRVSGVSAPSIDIHSGQIIYINSIQPIQRLHNQSEEFRLRIGF